MEPEGMIRLPDQEQEQGVEEPLNPEADTTQDFNDEDDDIPPPVPPKKIKMTESEADFFDVSDDEENEDAWATEWRD
jgi:hypothetical protein